MTLNFRILLAISFFYGIISLQSQPSVSLIPSEITTILSATRAKEYIYTLAADSMLGRNTPSPQLEMAANYISDKFKSFGVESIGNSYFQHYDVQRLRLADNPQFLFYKNNSTIIFEAPADFVPFEMTAAKSIQNADFVFVGYGITATLEKYDDYDKIDATGKIVVVLKSAPTSQNDSTGRNFLLPIPYTFLRNKVENARKHGAIGLILINDPVHYQRLKPSGFPWPSLFPSIPNDALPLALPLNKERQILVIHAGERFVSLVFGSAENLKTFQNDIDKNFKPHSFDIPQCKADISINLDAEKFPVKNVMGIVRGSELPDEFVVVGGHYDHIGYSRGTKSKNSQAIDTIYNGADDNASGTTGLIMLAEAFAKSPVKPKRSVVFLAFSGEEKGLLGSKAFVEYSPIALGKVTAMINLDMIGRNNPDSLSIGGKSRCPEFSAINEDENSKLPKPFILAYDIEHFFFRSDQASFANKKIPVLFYFTKEHADYHGLGDEPNKIDYDKLTRITTLCARTLWRVANLEKRLLYVPMGGEE